MSREVWKPVVRYGKEIPGYFVSNHGRVKSVKNPGAGFPDPKKFRKFKDGLVMTGTRRSDGYLKYKFSIPLDLFEDYAYAQDSHHKNICRITISAHRLVMESFRPVEKYPPIPMKDWKRCPASAKQWIRDTAFVDHIDSNKRNNHISNLRWVTPKQNEPNRKAAA